MSSTISVTKQQNITIVETFSGGDAADNTLKFTYLNSEETLTASTTVPVTKHAEFSQAMTSGAVTLNLVALPGKTADETVVGTGLKVQLAKFTNPSTNANNITLVPGASSGFNIFGAASSVTLVPGQSVTFEGKDGSPDIDSSHRTIDVTGTTTQVIQCVFVLG